MACQYRDEGGSRGQRPATLRKLAATVFAVVCIVGPAMAWDWDAASVRFIAPAGNNIDSGTVVAPSAVVRNLGDSTASFPVFFSITPDYLDSVLVESLSSGDSITLTFSDWTALQRGLTTAACSTALSVDESTANDRISRTFTVRVRDVGADQVVAPVGIINYGLTVTPQAKVTNYGTSNVNSFRAIFRIGVFYTDSVTVRNLGPGVSRVVDFTDWTADTLGTFAVSCTTAYTSDVHPENDLAQDSCTVQVVPEDAGVMRVVAPRGLVDSGAVFAPQAMVRNFGTDTVSFPAIFKVGTYVDTQQVTNLASLDSVLVTFADWTAEPVGWLTTRCSTALAGDPLSSNDMRSDSVNVIVRTTDVGAVIFSAPPDTVDSGSVVPVKVWVRNFGLEVQSFPVMARIGTTFYADTVQVDSLAAGDSLEVTFADYTVPFRGSITARCSTLLTGDQVVANNRALKNIFRLVHDVGALSITAPAGVVPQDTVVIPAATLRNFGNTTDSFPVVFRIGAFYEDTVMTNDSMVTFKPCTLSVVGTFSVMCSTAMVADVHPTNDAFFDSVQVTSVGISAGDPTPGLPRVVTLRGNGPFAGRVAIEYGLPRSTNVRLEVYDACGRLVRVVASGASQAGYHTAVWKCTDQHGRAVAEGAYFVRLIADGVTLTSKVVKTE
jgi:hypothetical protein